MKILFISNLFIKLCRIINKSLFILCYKQHILLGDELIKYLQNYTLILGVTELMEFFLNLIFFLFFLSFFFFLLFFNLLFFLYSSFLSFSQSMTLTDSKRQTPVTLAFISHLFSFFLSVCPSFFRSSLIIFFNLRTFMKYFFQMLLEL